MKQCFSIMYIVTDFDTVRAHIHFGVEPKFLTFGGSRLKKRVPYRNVQVHMKHY